MVPTTLVLCAIGWYWMACLPPQGQMLWQRWYLRRGCVCPVGRNLPFLVSETVFVYMYTNTLSCCISSFHFLSSLPLHSFFASFPSLLSPLLFVLFLSFPDSCKLLVETSSISHLTPSLISHCALVHCESSVMTFDTIVDTWLDKAPMQHNLSAMRSVCLFSQTIYKESRLFPIFLFHVALRLWPQ